MLAQCLRTDSERNCLFIVLTVEKRLQLGRGRPGTPKLSHGRFDVKDKKQKNKSDGEYTRIIKSR